jgi:hypothetical protein
MQNENSYPAEQDFITGHIKSVVADLFSGMNGLKGATESKATMQSVRIVMIQDKGTSSKEAVFINKY